MESKKFKSWIILTIVIGLLPWFINLFIIFIFSGNIGFLNIFKISDLNFFAIFICASTLFDILYTNRISDNSILVLILFLIFSSLSLGIILYNENFPKANQEYSPNLIRHTWFSIVISVLALLYTFSIQWKYYKRKNSNQ